MFYSNTFETAEGNETAERSETANAVALAGDHNGVQVKAAIVDWLTAAGVTVTDLGVHDPAATVDYPPLCVELCREVTSGRSRFGIFVGGTGQGEVIACNKIRGIRAGGCHNLLTAEISRGHNDANVLVLGSKLMDTSEALAVVGKWLTTPFKGGRHADRLAMIDEIESRQPPTL